MTKVLTNSTTPQFKGWLEVEMSDSELAEWIETACISEIEANREIFTEQEFERLTKEK